MNKKNHAKRSRMLGVIALLLVVCAASIGSTIAWLTDSTETVTNTFSPTGIDITLEETWNTDSDDEDTDPDSWTAELIPGKEYTKDPKVTVKSTTDVPVYLFVKVDDTTCDTYLNYEYNWDDGWTKLDGIAETVYWREVPAYGVDQSWELLKDNKVTVDSALTKEGMPDANVTMNFTAYAIQTEGFADAAAAWAEVSKV